VSPAPPREIYLATGNAGKVTELAELLGLGDRLRPPPADFVFPEETGATYAENALLKARALAHAVGAPAIGDDSGLEIEALGGRPGLHSARYAPSDRERIAKVLGELGGVPPEQRRARFVCALALVSPDGSENVVHGVCPGRITDEPRGEGGFGYDPIFAAAALGGRTFGEAPPEEKARLSHRAAAARALKSLLPPGLANTD
jgi:XTP/dITP diphosphohydrolase